MIFVAKTSKNGIGMVEQMFKLIYFVFERNNPVE